MFDLFLINSSSYKCSCLITKCSIHFPEFNKSSSFWASSQNWWQRWDTVTKAISGLNFLGQPDVISLSFIFIALAILLLWAKFYPNSILMPRKLSLNKTLAPLSYWHPYGLHFGAWPALSKRNGYCHHKAGRSSKILN